jgi:hypothetical protein
VSTFTAEFTETQRGQPRQPQAPPPRVSAVVTDCGQCGRPTAVPANAPGPHRCQRCIEARRRTPRQADADEGARVDALVLAQFRRWSIPELREYVELADRDTGGYPAWCHAQAAKILDARTRAFDPDFLRYSMIEDGCGDFAGMTDAEVTSAVKGLGVDEDDWERERAAQAAWVVGQAEGARAETDG